MPIPLFSPRQLISPALAGSPRGTLETIKIKSFNNTSGNTPVVEVEGKFLCVIVFGEVCRVGLAFKSGLVVQDLIKHW